MDFPAGFCRAAHGEHPQNPSFEDNNPANEDPSPQERQKELSFTRNFLLLKVRVLAKSNFYLQIKKLVIFPDFSLLNRTRTKCPEHVWVSLCHLSLLLGLFLISFCSYTAHNILIYVYCGFLHFFFHPLYLFPPSIFLELG